MSTTDKLKAIRATIKQNWLDNQYLDMLERALTEGNSNQKNTAQTKINEWYWEVIWAK
jgi:hypothetical protein